VCHVTCVVATCVPPALVVSVQLCNCVRQYSVVSVGQDRNCPCEVILQEHQVNGDVVQKEM
jgi:hypothetical protein